MPANDLGGGSLRRIGSEECDSFSLVVTNRKAGVNTRQPVADAIRSLRNFPNLEIGPRMRFIMARLYSDQSDLNVHF